MLFKGKNKHACSGTDESYIMTEPIPGNQNDALGLILLPSYSLLYEIEDMTPHAFFVSLS